MKVLKHLAVMAVLFAALNARAASRVDCGVVESKILGHSVPYCVMLPPSYDQDKQRTYPVLYYLHGLGDNEQSMINTGAWAYYLDLLDQRKVGEFLIATPNGYRTFYINSADGKVRYEDFFIKEFLPVIERKYRVRAGRSQRGLLGISMGGYGAMRYAFKYPQLFGSVSTHMAALREGRLPEFGGTSREAQMTAAVFGEPLNVAYYKSQNPFTLARETPVEKLRHLAIYFDCGRDDHYGFAEGATQMDALLSRRGIPHEFHIYPGNHSAIYVMQHFAASLEWESRAFGVLPK